MTKKDFIGLADAIIKHNKIANRYINYCPTSDLVRFDYEHLQTLADFCQSQNQAFNRERWLGYITGTNGPSGGAVK